MPGAGPTLAPLAPASLPRRLAALVYDTLLIAGLFVGFTFIVVLARGMRPVEPESGWLLFGLLAIGTLFYAWFWTHGGQTLGMRAWKIRLVTRAGEPVRWSRAFARCAAAALAALPAGCGYWWCLFDRDKLCWHDRLSATVPVRTAPRTVQR